MAKIKQLSQGHQEQVDYEAITKKHPWIVQKSQKCVLSRDSDGFLCGLLVSQFLDWEIKGFYDGKVLIIKEDVQPENCIFLDVDINRTCVRSIGHHIIAFNRRLSPPNFNYTNCIQPNLLRNFDGKNDFQRKYPFGTIHLLLGLLQKAQILGNLSENAIWPLLFTDGVWNNLFGYTENCLDWINYLGISGANHILNPIFCENNYSFYDIMRGLNEFLRMRDNLNAKGYYLNGEYQLGGRNKRTGDKLMISNTQGIPLNLEETGSSFKIHIEEKERIKGFITRMCRYLEWEYLPEKWSWENLKLFKFTTEDFSNRRLNNGTYIELMAKNPLSLAMTSGTNIEYTLEEPDRITPDQPNR